MLWTTLLLGLTIKFFPDDIHGQAITSPPEHFTGITGGSATFSCQVELFGIQKSFAWEFNSNPIYIHQYDTEDYPLGEEKYAVTKESGTFTLKVKDLIHIDGGLYTCLVLGHARSAVLLVLGKPHLFTSSSNPVEGSVAKFICKAKIGGPKKEQISPEQYPHLEMFLDGDTLNGRIQEQDLQESTEVFNLTEIYNATLKLHMDGKELMCEIKTISPAMCINTTVNVKVLKLTEIPSSENDSWKVAVGITIPVLIIFAIVGVAAFYYREHFRKLMYHPVSSEDSMDLKSVEKTLHKKNYPRASQVLSESIEEVDIKPGRSKNSKYNKLTKTIDNLTIWSDLNEATANSLSRDITENPPTEKPSLLMQLINKSEILIQSNHFIVVCQAVAQKYLEIWEKIQEDPLLLLVKKLEKGSVSPLIQFPKKLLDLIEVLLQFKDSTDTWGRCVRVLIKNTKEWRQSQGEFIVENDKSNSIKLLQWNSDLIKVLLALGKRADPAWSPKDSSQGSNLHLLVAAIKYVMSHNNDLVKNIMDLFEVMMTEQSLDCNNVDGEGMTILHTLVDGKKRPLKYDFGKQLLQIINIIKTMNPSLLDSKNYLNYTPLHTFITSSLAVNRKNVSEAHRYLFIEAAKQWRDGREACLQVVQSLISLSNTNIQCKDMKTPLYCFTEYANEWRDHPHAFLDLVKCLRSAANIDICESKNRTPLYEFVLVAKKWKIHAQILLEVIKSITSAINIDIQTDDKFTPLCQFTTEAVVWADKPDPFMEVINHLKSEKNIDYQDKNGYTPLHHVTHKAEIWATYPDIFLRYITCLKSSSNINIQCHSRYTPLHHLMSAASKWSNHSDTFLKIVKCLKSPTNVNLPNNSGDAPFASFTAAALEWADHADTFLEVVQCLKSDVNIDMYNHDLPPPLYIFTRAVEKWTNSPNAFLGVLKCLKSDSSVKFHTDNRSTPLHQITSAAHKWTDHSGSLLEVIKCLKFSSNIDIQNDEGSTPLHHVVLNAQFWEAKPDEFLKVIQCLKSASNVKLKDKAGRTPLELFKNEKKQSFAKVEKLLKVA